LALHSTKPLVAMNTLNTTIGIWIFNDQGN